MNIIQELEKEEGEAFRRQGNPRFGPGDTVVVNVKVIEGDRDACRPTKAL